MKLKKYKKRYDHCTASLINVHSYNLYRTFFKVKAEHTTGRITRSRAIAQGLEINAQLKGNEGRKRKAESSVVRAAKSRKLNNGRSTQIQIDGYSNNESNVC